MSSPQRAEHGRFVRQPSQDPSPPHEPEQGPVGTRDEELAEARARIATLGKALSKEQEARRREVASLRRSLRTAAAEREQLDRQLHLVWLQLDHAEAQLAWAELPRWRKLLRRAPG